MTVRRSRHPSPAARASAVLGRNWQFAGGSPVPATPLVWPTLRARPIAGLGYITCKEMATVCKVLGEDLDEDEVNDMVSEAISNFQGKIYYDGFVKILLAN